MKFKVTKIKPVKKEGKFWLVTKVIIINWVLFALAVSSYVIWQQTLKFKDMEKRLEICQNNMELINEQIGSGRVLLELKGKK